MMLRRVVGALFMGNSGGRTSRSGGGRLSTMGRIARFSSLSSLTVNSSGAGR